MERILVGVCPEGELMLEREMLMAQFYSFGINYTPFNCKWLRDSFVNHNGNIYKRRKYGFYADGGYILNDEKFTVACTDVSKNNDIEHSDSTEKRYEKLKRLYGENIFILPSPDLRLNKNLSPHIDLVVLPIPEKKVLFVDSKYYNETAKNEIDKLCHKYNLKLEKTFNDYDKPSYPCNSLVIKKDDRIIVVTNETDNERFISKLKNYGLDVIAVPFSVNCSHGGSVHCATNTIPDYYNTNRRDLEELINW